MSKGCGYGRANVEFSIEPSTAFETGGGIFHALPLLGEAPFAVVNADIWTDFDFATIPTRPKGLAHLVLVPNPDHNQCGDFSLETHQVTNVGDNFVTFSGISVLDKVLFAESTAGRFPLAPLLRDAADAGQVTGELYQGHWFDSGTVERFTQIDKFIASQHRTFDV